MNYKFTIDKFQGPLDLLLHLIKEADIDIFDINIAQITEQYLKYIKSMENLNLNIDSEYLVMAAELIEMKSRILLPHEEMAEVDEDEEDPREALINRLIEYKKYKEISQTLHEMECERKQSFSKLPSKLDEFKTNELSINEDITLNDLIEAFKRFQEKKNFSKPLNTVVTRKEYSIHKRNKEILNVLKNKKHINFEELFEIRSKDYVVVTFLSILDLAKKGKLKIKQNNNLDTIVLEAREEL